MPFLRFAAETSIEGFIIPAKASEPQAAMDFLAYQGSTEVQTYWAEELGPVGGIPTRSDVDLTVFSPAMQKARGILQDADELSQIIFLTGSPLIGPMFYDRPFQSFLTDPGALDEILDKLESKRQEVFEE